MLRGRDHACDARPTEAGRDDSHPTGQAPSNVQTKTVIVPASEQKIRTSNRQIETVEIPEKTVLVPTYVPLGLEPLRLPDDFNQTIDNKFCFILQNNAGSNYSLNVKGLNDYDLSSIVQSNKNNIDFLNATEALKQNAWYKVTTSITDNGVATSLQNADGAIIQSKTNLYRIEGNNESVLLIANDADSAIVLKDLKIQTVNNASQLQPQEVVKIPNQPQATFPYVYAIFLLAVTFVAALIYIKKKKSQKK